ncbi:MAG: hypothetical protein A2987_05850 [Omnitrophica bacterium RIFCSPLOWO2_01_FULL_45_10]|nr:MAG: hypothetical protein A2987_05850 [Omnitrophica bacterium RIFCSPLOWO2_01_FULL_45_10]
MFTLNTKLSICKALLFKDSPFYIQFYISNKCHLKCRMCNIMEANRDTALISIDRIGKIADNLVDIGAGVILLTGGEPFLREDIGEIARIFIGKKLDIRLQTAGLYAKKDLIAKCAEYGARDINVSFASLDEKKADYINGAAGSWQDAVKTISFISGVFPCRDSICAIGCVLSPYNIDEIDALLDFATRIGWWMSLVPAHITTKDKPMNFRGHDEHFRFKADDFPKIKNLIDRLKRKKKEGYLLFDSDEYLDSISSFITTGSPSWRQKEICDSPNFYFAIMPDGRFAPCCDLRFDEEIYLYDDHFPKIYKSKEFRNRVKVITEKCPGCNFGSFPEMTLSARSFSAIRERASVYFKAKTNGIKSYSAEELFDMISNIKDGYEVYKH